MHSDFCKMGSWGAWVRFLVSSERENNFTPFDWKWACTTLIKWLISVMSIYLVNMSVYVCIKQNIIGDERSSFRLLISLQWHHNERDSVSNHQPCHCLINRLFWRRSKKTPKHRVTGLCAGNSPVTGEFPAQRASIGGDDHSSISKPAPMNQSVGRPFYLSVYSGKCPHSYVGLWRGWPVLYPAHFTSRSTCGGRKDV